MRVSAVVGVVVVVLVSGCAGTQAPSVDLQKEEQAIRALDAAWNTAVAKKELDALVGFYAPDGATMWPDAPASRGPAAIRAAWKELLNTPGLAANIVPDRIRVAQAGDLAVDEGHVDLEMDSPQGRARETVKYVVNWIKVGGAWKVAYDMYNSNAPSAPPPPAKGK